MTVASERGIAELGVSEHVYRFEQALEVWQHPFWRECPRGPRRVLRVRARADGSEAGDRGGLRARRRGSHGESAGGARLRLRGRLGALPARRGGRHGRLQRVGQRPQPRGDLAALLPDPRRGRPQRAVRRAGAPRSGEGVGRDRPRPEGDLRRYYELAIEGIAESGIAVEVSTAGLRKRARELYPGAGVPARCAWKRARRWRFPATPTGPRTWARTTSRRWSCWRRRACRSCACSSGASAGWSRSAPSRARGRGAMSLRRDRL